MKATAKSYAWWPNIDNDIERCVKLCESCQQNRNDPPKAPRQFIEKPLNPWSTLYVDFAGPFMSKTYLIVVDAMSKWVEVDIVKSMSSAEVIRSFRRMFARNGIPDLIISDNGTAFKSEEIQEFYKKNAIQYRTTALFHPSSNGQAERVVQFVKKSLSTLTEDDVELKLQRILFRQHTTVNTATGKTPSELLMGRKLSQILDKIHPYSERDNVHRETDNSM